VRQYCDSAIMIEDGVIIKQGKAEVIAQAYQKLFATEAEAAMKKEMQFKTKIAKEDRWGSGSLMVDKSTINLNDDEVTISVTYIANRKIDPPILGFNIYDSAGTDIVEGNTQRSRKKTYPMEPGEKVIIKWQIPNIFKDDSYNISLSCCDQSTVNFYDWFNKANSFTISRGSPTAAIVAPKVTIKSYSKINGSAE